MYDLLRARGAALVIGDHPERPFQTHELTADWTFIRFHYGSRGRAATTPSVELEQWARRIDGLASDGPTSTPTFNNDWRGYAVNERLVV